MSTVTCTGGVTHMPLFPGPRVVRLGEAAVPYHRDRELRGGKVSTVTCTGGVTHMPLFPGPRIAQLGEAAFPCHRDRELRGGKVCMRCTAGMGAGPSSRGRGCRS